MTPKEQALKMVEGRIDSIQRLSIEIFEHIYIAAYNEAIEDAAKAASGWGDYEETQIRALKK